VLSPFAPTDEEARDESEAFVRTATLHLLTVKVDECLTHLEFHSEEISGEHSDPSALVCALHKFGINVRFLALLLLKLQNNDLIVRVLHEMVARVIKVGFFALYTLQTLTDIFVVQNILRKQQIKAPSDEVFRRVVIQLLNEVLSFDEFWEAVVMKEFSQKFALEFVLKFLGQKLVKSYWDKLKQQVSAQCTAVMSCHVRLQ
jgi:hypothetical protein